MLKFLKNIFDPNIAAINKVTPIVDQILALEGEMQNKSLEEMKSRVQAMREELKPLLEKIRPEDHFALKTVTPETLSDEDKQIQAKLQEFLPEFFAFLREINRRKFAKPHYRVQLIASTILAQGYKLTELKTGEGKTQVFHLPAALYGLTGRGAHVVTVNDYLARRDGEYAGHAMSDLGISVGIITPQASYIFVNDEDLAKVKGEEAASERSGIDISKLTDMKGINLQVTTKQEAYKQDVVYATNNELGFDYLRDNMAYDLKSRVQSELYFCIIDEADSILIDEARTPLIISAPAEASNELYEKFAKIVVKLEPEKHYAVDEKAHSASLTEEGVEYVENLLGVSNIWEDYRLAHHLDNALKALTLYKVDEEYIIKNGEILIVDEFTGRVLPGRRYSDGLHQAIEAKEGVEIKRESKTLATITFQNFFKLYKVLGGGSGTIMTEAEEFLKIYNLESYAIPTNKPVIRQDKTDKVYKHRIAKFNAVINEIHEVHATGRPILVGTTSVEASELVSRMLDKQGVEHEVLNAKFHEREAAIVAKAGERNAVTVATNMAGRGTDIPLGEGIKELGGLHIVGTERHEARRIDNQLRGRGGRQGEPGTTQFFIALDDEIMRIQGGDIVKRLMEMANIPDEYPIESGLIGRSIESAQKKMEGHNFDIRKRVVEYDNVMNQQREIFYTRRYNLLKLIANYASAETKEQKDQVIVEIKAASLAIIDEEVETILNNHFLANRSDQIDKQKLVRDFLDLVNDEQLKSITGKGLAHLEKEVADLNFEQVKEYLIDLLHKVAEQKFSEFAENLPEIYKITSLQVMDELWTGHLNAMTDLREGIGLRGYAQRDPLVEYKNEGLQLFDNFINNVNSQIARRVLKIQRVVQQAPVNNMQTNQDQVEDVLTGTRELGTSLLGNKPLPKQKSKPRTTKYDKVGRNDPCPCGSGLKYKKCGMINAPQHKG